MKTLIDKLNKKATISIECLPEEIPVRGNASSIDDQTDKETENRIIEELENGNDWAWCTVKVIAKLGEIEGCYYLGCCSYESEDDFKKGGYYDDMKTMAIEDLAKKIERLESELKAA